MIRRSRISRVSAFAAASVVGSVFVAACSGTAPGSGFDSTDNGGSGSGSHNGSGDGGSGSNGDNGGGGGGGGSFGGGGGGGGGNADAACASEVTKGEQQPLDMYIMLDQSGSMTESVAGGSTKWKAVTGALNTFFTQPGVAGIGVGLQYFGLPPGGGGTTCPTTCNTNADCGAGGQCFIGQCICAGGGADSCNAADYATPDVEIAPLPGVAAALSQSIGKHNPTTSTPTSAALQGAVDHAKAWAQNNTGHVVIAVLATDGDPTECDTNLTNINNIASTAANGTPKILTFVIGVGSSLTALNGIAAAGGTTSAFIVDTTQNVNQQFLDALNKIRGSALGCTYKIPVPKAGKIDYGQVNVQYTPAGGGAPVLIPKVADKGHCPATGDAWYYDDNNNPTQILLCASSCGTVTAGAGGQVDVLTGCKSVVK